MKILFAICCFLAIAITGMVNPDPVLETLNERLLKYRKAHPSTNLFLHLDKSVYSQNEDIWFKAYVLSGEVLDNSVLYIRLTNERKELMLSEQFPVYDVRAHGEMLLPDTLKDGSYYLYAYTDRMINFSEDDVFVQKIRVQREASKRLEASASVADTNSIRRGQRVQINLQLKEGIHLLKGIRGRYELIDDKKVLRTGRITTNLFGEATVDFTYPQLADDHSLQFRAVFDRNSDYAELNLHLRHEAIPYSIKVFPEGGNLISGFSNRVIVEVLDAKGYPVADRFNLTSGDQVLSSFSTNKYGVASIMLKPLPGKQYSIRYLKQGVLKQQIPLRVQSQGYGLAVGKKGSQLVAQIKNANDEEEVTVGFRSVDEVLFIRQLKVPKADSVLLPFSFKDIPKNVVSVFLIDASSHVKAERLILRPGSDDFNLKVSTDQSVYGARKRVKVDLSASDNVQQPVLANLSVAVVEKSRVDVNDYRNILNSYYYRFLDGKNCNYYISENIEKDIDNLLITKRWKNGSTHDLLHFVSHRPLALLENTGGVNGEVKMNYKGKFDLQKLTILSKEKGVIINVNNDGKFAILPNALLSSRANKWNLLQSSEFLNKYHVIFNNHDQVFDKRVLVGNALYIPTIFSSFSDNKPAEITKAGNGTKLRTVEIKGKANFNTPIEHNLRLVGCDAYVCRNNILNCPNHPTDGGIPEEGRVYRSANGPVVYRCRTQANEILIKNIIMPKEFKHTDFEKEEILEPAFETTLFWNPNLNTNNSGKASFSFFTNDLKGEFLIIAQGISVNTLRPIQGRTAIKVQ